MNAIKILKKLNINPDEPVLLITAEEALENILEAVEEYCSELKIEEMKRKDLLALLKSYGEAVINYHPEKYHQERAALIENFENLKKYGLTDKDYNFIDFC